MPTVYVRQTAMAEIARKKYSINFYKICLRVGKESGRTGRGHRQSEKASYRYFAGEI